MERTTRRRTVAKGRGGKRRKVYTCPPEEDDMPNSADKIIFIELISREVFRRLNFKDLLNCSLVNRTWRGSARLYLRSHCRCFLSFSPKTMKLKQTKFIDLYDLLTNSSDIPFNGISINKEGFTLSSEDSTSSSESDVSSDESAEEGIDGKEFHDTEGRFISAFEWEEALGRLEVKYLELDWTVKPVSPSSRMAIKEILRRSSSTLVDLTVLRWGYRRGLLHLLHTFGVNVLRNVKVLQLPGKDWRERNAVGLEELLNALPRLQSIRGPVDLLSLPAFIRTNKQHLIHEFDFATSSVLKLEGRDQKAAEELLEIATTFARSQPKLTKVTFLTEGRGFISLGLVTAERYFSVMEVLVRGGAEVLKEVEIRYKDLMKLIRPSHPISHVQRHSPPLFPAVTNLSLQFDFGILTTDLNRTGLKSLNLEAHFPLLHSVELEFAFSGPFLPNDSRTEEYCCKSVRRVVVRSASILSLAGTVTSLGASFTWLFPMVRVLVLKDCSELEDIVESVRGFGRASWEELRVLRVEGITRDLASMNWDPLFTGLSRMECDRLKRQRGPPDVQFRLKPLEWRRASLLDFQKLEKLQLGMKHHEVCLTRRGAGQAFASKLIAECVSLMGLRVEIKRRLCQKQLNCYQAVNYLQPFVHIIDKFTD